jgi:hypothetical protein
VVVLVLVVSLRLRRNLPRRGSTATTVTTATMRGVGANTRAEPLETGIDRPFYCHWARHCIALPCIIASNRIAVVARCEHEYFMSVPLR